MTEKEVESMSFWFAGDAAVAAEAEKSEITIFSALKKLWYTVVESAHEVIAVEEAEMSESLAAEGDEVSQATGAAAVQGTYGEPIEITNKAFGGADGVGVLASTGIVSSMTPTEDASSSSTTSSTSHTDVPTRKNAKKTATKKHFQVHSFFI